ncbi:hypothetical protein RND81_06G140200 [Saponaria officinalis]|uniref:Wax synthase domain-containing protein n=1 Tax=Saponaria officinalis TaxID=3572 RepID=A0AAW1KAC1_SAPOF
MNSSPLLKLLSILLISYCYSYFLAKKLPRGMPRLMSMLVVFYAFFRIPRYFPSSILLRGFASFFISWISSFKLILFCFDKGDLTLCHSYIDFVVVAAFPLKINPKFRLSPCHHSSRLRKIVLILTISLIIFFFHDTALIFPTSWIVIFIYLCTKPHTEVIPLLNEPHKSTSLQTFWGKRWNKISSNVLRETIYDPIKTAINPYKDDNNIDGRTKVVALIITLIVSGIMHEIMFYHMSCGMKPTWEVTYFFVLHGICMAFEMVVKRSWVRTLGWSTLHPVISVPLTLGFLLVTSYWLLVLPVWRISGMRCDV